MWNKLQIIEVVIVSHNEVKKTVAFKTCGPDSALVFRRRTVYSSLHFPPWLKNCLNSVYSVFFDMWWSHWYTIFKISLWQTRYKALQGTVPPKLLNLEQMTSMTSVASFPFYFQLTVSKIFEAGWRSSNALWTKSFYQAIEDNLSVFLRTRQTSQMFAFRRQTAYSFWTLAVPGNCFISAYSVFRWILGILVQVLKYC